MYIALESFATKDYDVKRTEILKDDFTTQDEIDEFLRIKYIAVYDECLEIYENGIYNVEGYKTTDVYVEASQQVKDDVDEINGEVV